MAGGGDLVCDVLDAEALDDAGDGLADGLVVGPVGPLLLLGEVAHQLAPAAHLQAPYLQGHRAQAKPRPVQQLWA